MDNNFTKNFLTSVKEISEGLDSDKIDKAAAQLRFTKEQGGRVFVLGLGGGAAHSLHFAADLRKQAGMNVSSPVENIVEFSALINDEGWNECFVRYLERNNLNASDTIVIISVGGGDTKKNVSMNIVKAIDFAKQKDCRSISVSGRADGYAHKNCDISILINPGNKNSITPLTEGVQSVILHLIASHPEISEVKPKWESFNE